MAMKELLRVELDAKKIRKACEWWVQGMTKGPDAEYTAIRVPDDLCVTVVLTKKRAARKARAGNGAVASAGPLSEQEERFA